MEKIYIITDFNERFKELEIFLTEFNVPYEIFPPVYCDNSNVGIRKAHQNVVQYAKNNNLPRIIIAEDDMMFSYGMTWEIILNKLEDVPKDADIFLGGTHRLNVTERITNEIFRTDYFSTTHFYVVYERFYDRFLANEDPQPVDIWMSTSGINAYINYPFIAYQRKSFSIRQNRVIDYTKYVKACVDNVKRFINYNEKLNNG